ncbi:FUSC family protein, partial [Desulfovibrio sp.]
MTKAEFNSTQAHIHHGVKTGLAAVLAYVAADWLRLPFGYWAAISAVIVMQVSVADSIRMCWYRFSGTAVGAAIAAVAILAFPANRPMTILALFLSVAFCAYMTRYNARYRMAAITTVIVFLASLGQPERLVFGMERVLEIALGVSCAFVVSVALWPQRAGDVLRERLRRQFTALADLYGDVLDAFLNRQSMLSLDPLERLERDVAADRGLLKSVRHHERLLYRDDTAALD